MEDLDELEDLEAFKEQAGCSLGQERWDTCALAGAPIGPGPLGALRVLSPRRLVVQPLARMEGTRPKRVAPPGTLATQVVPLATHVALTTLGTGPTRAQGVLDVGVALVAVVVLAPDPAVAPVAAWNGVLVANKDGCSFWPGILFPCVRTVHPVRTARLTEPKMLGAPGRPVAAGAPC